MSWPPLIRLHRLDDAETELNRAVALGGGAGIVAYRYLGALYSERGENARAIKALQQYLKLMPAAREATQVEAVIKHLRGTSHNWFWSGNGALSHCEGSRKIDRPDTEFEVVRPLCTSLPAANR